MLLRSATPARVCQRTAGAARCGGGGGANGTENVTFRLSALGCLTADPELLLLP